MQGEFFTSLLDVEFMLSLCDVINSPLVQVEPAARLVYYNLIFHGGVLGGPRSQITARGLYLQCLHAVPAWQACASGTMLDLIASSLMTFTTAISFDYTLAWKFHRQACEFVKQRGLDRLNALDMVGLTKTEIDNQRLGFWQLVLVDIFFRFFANKPSSISSEASVASSGVPPATDVTHQRPRAGRTIVNTIWQRVLFVAKEFFEHYDRVSIIDGGTKSHQFQKKVDSLCDEIEEMIDDWQLTLLMESYAKKPMDSWLCADTIVGTLNILLEMDKLRQSGAEPMVSERSKRAARLILDTTINFDEMLRNSSKPHGALYMYCIAFYPFRAFFSLYYHILKCDDPADCEQDVLRLDKIGTVMVRAAQSRFEWIPIAKAIVSLNQVTKFMQQRQDMSSTTPWEDAWPERSNSGHLLSIEQAHMADSVSRGLPLVLQQPEFAQWLPDHEGMHFSTAADFQHAAAQPDFRPIEYMQAIEEQFAERGWNYGW
ncbi:uncharacterized protein HMPREF1541_05419 [Cyphellophora europaea CBS 101466]|uniref:Transcription factor domain-containing protein n=1 Tax=Cyphellophora europaea (strain CBS 101466) TaxID=1220924 RepID=W2RRP1_CYPE1|nr:uncharacterized protein HMPREF1541_05419 [Cyphellophora europaea CBS 101466]ETN39196.1 hypothetical protein HMPREF1541_05419 [Cyphellophora europaea CBS 101466]